MIKRLSVFVFVMLFAVTFASADLAVLGTVYENGLGGTLSSGAFVSVTCDITLRTDTTGADGVYAVLFDSITECPDNSSMTVAFSKSGFNTFSGDREINYSTIANTGSLFSIVADHSLVEIISSDTSSSKRSSSSGAGSICYAEFWDCGDWNVCTEDLEQTRECVSNCGSIKTELRFCEDLTDSGSDDDSDDSVFSELDGGFDEAPADGFLSRITGAVVGTLGAGGSFVAAVFVALVVAGFVFTRMKNEEDLEDAE